ncbi:MAG: YdjY domain-containing protein [Candidatus Pacebacteria bacterium]|nr:YdjY domain-containing protein [Candidatus Paceibacterota bacterium]
MTAAVDFFRFVSILATSGLLVITAEADAQDAATQTGKPRDIRFQRLPNGDVKLGQIHLHRKSRTLSFPATINLDSGALEVLIATPEGRLHESLLSSAASPFRLQTMLFLLGVENGPRRPDEKGNQGDLVDIDLEWTKKDGTTVREPVETWVLNSKTNEPMKRRGWVFVGSRISDGMFVAETEGNLVVTYSIGETILDIPSTEGEDDTVFVVNQGKTEPAVDSPVRVILTPRPSTLEEEERNERP